MYNLFMKYVNGMETMSHLIQVDNDNDNDNENMFITTDIYSISETNYQTMLFPFLVRAVRS